ncbi:MAG TPA: hypothetical protein VF669_17540 [Tepidisphaeraceae bacterium]|jgi:hypothetical protein
MTVAVQLHPELAAALNGAGKHRGAVRVRAAAKRAGARLVAMHPNVNDPQLAKWFYADVPSSADAQKLASELQQVEGVEAAYAKPDAEPP